MTIFELSCRITFLLSVAVLALLIGRGLSVLRLWLQRAQLRATEDDVRRSIDKIVRQARRAMLAELHKSRPRDR